MVLTTSQLQTISELQTTYSYRLLQSYRLLCSYGLLHSYRLLNGFNSKVVCKNSSVTIWEILFNITMPIIHHKLYSNEGVCHKGGREGFHHFIVKTPLGSVTMGKPLWYASVAYHNGRRMKTLHRHLYFFAI